MANKKVSELTAATAVAPTDNFMVAQGSLSRKATFQKIIDGIFSQQATIVVPAPASDAEVRAAQQTLALLGGGTVQLTDGVYTFSATVELLAGVRFVGTNFMGMGTIIAGLGDAPDKGTIVRGATQSIDLFSLFPTAHPAYPTLASYPFGPSNKFVSNCRERVGIENIALDFCRYGIRIGNHWTGGIFFSRFANLVVTRFTDWGVWFANFGGCIFSNIFVGSDASLKRDGGHMMFAAFQGSDYNNGNSYQEYLSANSGSTLGSRGIVYMSNINSQMNDVFGNMLQQNNFAGTPDVITRTATITSGNPDIVVSGDIAQLPIDHPVEFPTSNAATGFFPKTLYFITQTNGVDTIRLSKRQGSTAEIPSNFVTPSGSGSLTMRQRGWPCLEIVGKHISANGIQSIQFNSVDLEGTCPCTLFTQDCYAHIVVVISETAPQDVGGQTLVGMHCARNFQGTIAGLSSPIDWDSQSAKYGTPLDYHVFSDSGSDYNMEIGDKQIVPAGICFDRLRGTKGLNLAAGRNGLYGLYVDGSGNLLNPNEVQAVNAFGTGAWHFNVPIAKRTRHLATASVTFFAEQFWSWVYIGASNGSWNLVNINNGAGTFFDHNGVGVDLEVSNPTAFELTLVATNANFNFNANATQLTILPGGSVILRVMYNGTTRSWVPLSLNNARTNDTGTGVRTGLTTAGLTNLTSVTNVSDALWTQQNNIVRVNGTLDVLPVTAGIATSFRLSLPVPTNITAVGQLVGSAVFEALPAYGGGYAARVKGNVANDAAEFSFIADSNASHTLVYDFAYQLRS